MPMFGVNTRNTFHTMYDTFLCMFVGYVDKGGDAVNAVPLHPPVKAAML